MKKKEQFNPTPSELAILQILWKEGPATVREIHDILAEEKEVVYTTILKTMQVMYDRRMLTREAQGRKHIYAAAIGEDATQTALLDKFVDRTFGGSAMQMVMKALGSNKTSQKELEELKKYIDDIENKQRS